MFISLYILLYDHVLQNRHKYNLQDLVPDLEVKPYLLAGSMWLIAWPTSLMFRYQLHSPDDLSSVLYSVCFIARYSCRNVTCKFENFWLRKYTDFLILSTQEPRENSTGFFDQTPGSRLNLTFRLKMTKPEFSL